jgi:hypothetical protein
VGAGACARGLETNYIILQNTKIMARQKSILKLSGKIGDLSFFKTKDGYMAREKTGVSASRIATAPEFQRTRENNAEFGRAGKACKTLRDAFRLMLQQAGDRKLVQRLTSEMMKVLKLDETSIRGQRNVLDGELEVLQGFEVNSTSLLSASFFAPYTATIDRVTGAFTVAIPAFIPSAMVGNPGGATHFRIAMGGASIDFQQQVSEHATTDSGYLPLNGVATAPLSLSVSLSPNSAHPLFLGMAVEFFQEVNTVHYALNNGSSNCMSFVKVLGL